MKTNDIDGYYLPTHKDGTHDDTKFILLKNLSVYICFKGESVIKQHWWAYHNMPRSIKDGYWKPVKPEEAVLL